MTAGQDNLILSSKEVAKSSEYMEEGAGGLRSEEKEFAEAGCRFF